MGFMVLISNQTWTQRSKASKETRCFREKHSAQLKDNKWGSHNSFTSCIYTKHDNRLFDPFDRQVAQTAV